MKNLAILVSVFALLLVGCNEEEVNSLKEQNASILKDKATLEEDKATLEEKIGNLEKELETLQAENSALEDKLKVAAEKGKSLAGDLAEAEKQISKLQVEKEDIAISNFNRVLEASRLKNEQRKISNMEVQLSAQSELSDIALEKEKINLVITKLEGEKIGKGRTERSAIDKNIIEEKKKQINLDAKASNTRIFSNLRQEIFSDAQKKGLSLTQLEKIHASLLKVKNPDPTKQGPEEKSQIESEWKKIILDLDQMEKDNDKAKLNKASEAAIKALEAKQQRELKRSQE